MCIPGPSQQQTNQNVPAAPPSQVASMQAANNLVLGGSDRGSAQIGRLALRVGAPSSAVDGSAAQGVATSTATPSAIPADTSLGAGIAMGATSGKQALPGSANYSPNDSLRLGGSGYSRS